MKFRMLGKRARRAASFPAMMVMGMAAGLSLSQSQSAFAADWVVEQISTITSSSPVELTQRNAASSHQAVNGVLLNLNEDSLASLTQRVTFNTPALSLTQSENSDSSVQAVNIAVAQGINQLTQSVSQPNGSTTLTQNLQAAGNDNIQAINYASASGNINNANQSFIGQAMSLEKTAGTPSGNIQAVNYANAASYSGMLQQSVTVDTLTYANRPGGANDIRINSIQGDTASATVQQSVTVQGVLTVDPLADPTVILNHIRR